LELKFSHDFAHDLEDTQSYIRETHSDEQAAIRIAQLVLDALEPLKDFPELGLNFDERIGEQLIEGHVTRLLIVKKKYLVFYLVLRQDIYVLKFVNASTDYLNHLSRLFKNFSDFREEDV